MPESDPTENPVDLETDDNSPRVLAHRSIALFEQPLTVSDTVRISDHRGVAFQRQPSTTIHLADHRPTAFFGVHDLLRPIRGDDRYRPSVVSEGDSHHMRGAVGTHCGERAEMAFGQELEFGRSELIGSASHGRGGYRGA